MGCISSCIAHIGASNTMHKQLQALTVVSQSLATTVHSRGTEPPLSYNSGMATGKQGCQPRCTIFVLIIFSALLFALGAAAACYIRLTV